jgi:hypothetical protein
LLSVGWLGKGAFVAVAWLAVRERIFWKSEEEIFFRNFPLGNHSILSCLLTVLETAQWCQWYQCLFVLSKMRWKSTIP